MFELSPFKRHRNIMDNFMGRDLMRDFFNSELLSGFGPDIKADIKESAREYTVEAELPGINKDELVVELKDNTLTITAQKVDEINEESENYIRRERRHGTFSRAFYVENVDNTGVKADYKDGILKITLPKLQETNPNNYRININ
jgi:HSP20 family protein